MASSVDPASPHSGEAVRNLSSSWSNVSRGELERNSFATPLSSPSVLPIASPEITGRSPRKVSGGSGPALSSVGSEHGVSGNAADAVLSPMGKKTAWKFQSNGTIETGSIMDTVSWPALSESAKYSPKSVSSDLLKPVADVSNFTPPSAALSHSSKLVLSNQNSGSSQNPESPARQKSMKRGADTGGSMSSSGSLNGGVAMPSSLQVSEANQLVPGKQPSLGFLTSKGLQSKNYSNINNDKDHGSKAGGFSPQPYGGNEHQRGHGGVRRGSTGHHSNYGNKRESERGGYEWSHQNLGRDVHMQQSHKQLAVRPIQRPPSIVVAPFIAPPPPLRPFSNHFGFPDFPSPVYYVAAPPLPEPLRGVPFAPQASLAPQVMFLPTPDPQRAMLLKQIEYYFSPENLCKDIYLRQNMDEQGQTIDQQHTIYIRYDTAIICSGSTG
ncbi:la-related protein 1C-like isoform X2 [Phalaenopsis equestris]|uniref:la-related protein 1C-like isoform X2 n=1 Tax=Phalaenopsis equestris TaxID=78828 RepID=UPI0009E33603|nr:la-related protein 1C-like isoform X2 [Phalaenopsis equestris]